MKIPVDPLVSETDPAFSEQDPLLEEPPAVVEVLPERTLAKYPYPLSSHDFKAAWNDKVEMVSIWIMIKVPRDVPPGEYTGKVIISAGDKTS